MKRATLLERKRFAAELAERDALALRERFEYAGSSPAALQGVAEPSKPGARRGSAGRRTSAALGMHGADRSPGDAGERGAASFVVAKPEALPPTDAEVLDRYRMRRWWLDRYTLDEIRELAGCLR